MEFDPKQLEAIAAVKHWFIYDKSTKQSFTLAGRAGTGKSTIIKEAITQLGLGPDEVAFVAPTGKAAEVMRSKGILNAKTLHKLIYILKDEVDKEAEKIHIDGIEEIIQRMKNGENVTNEIHSKINKARVSATVNRPDLEFILKPELPGEFKLIVVDEASMVDDRQIEDLESFHVPVLYIGDHRQLKPVKGFNSRISEPDVTLEVIHRQGGDSGILTLANRVLDSLNGYIPRNWQNTSDTIVMDFGSFMDRFVKYGIEWPDQLLCCKNAIRQALNAYVRKMMGFTKPIPEVGDKLICLRNNYDIDLYNGLQGIVEEVDEKIEDERILGIKFRRLNGESSWVMIDKSVFLPGIPPAPKGTDLFDFGYAVTVHKSQGSEWRNVSYISGFFGQETRSLNYTAVTRASEKLVVVRPPSSEEVQRLLSLI